MNTFFARRGTGLHKSPASIRVGHVYLDVGRQSLFCLNEAAQQMVREGVPFTRGDLHRRPLRTLAGEPVKADDLPLMRAWCDKTPHEAVFLYTGPDGAVRHLTCNAAPLVDPGGPVRAVLGSVVLTPPEPDWQQLAGLAHDLRTPLQALRLLMPSLETSPPHPEARLILERIRPSADRALAIGMDLLEWTRNPVVGGRRADRYWFALASLLDDLAEEHRAHAQSKSIACVANFEIAQGLEVHTDRVRLGRLLSNLLTNAIRYTSRGWVRLTASWRTDDAGRKTALGIGVEDTGGGISPEDQESIFQPFERGKAGKDSDSDGSGMGLAVVDRLVEELGLTLEVFSEYGLGSKFEVVLPIQDVRLQAH